MGLVLAVVAAAAAVGAWLVDRRRRRYLDHPTTPAAAVFAGRNEVKGRVWSDTPLVAHRTGTPCVWWTYELEEERRHTRTVTDTDSEGRSRTRTETYNEWHTVDDRSDMVEMFEVIDASGRVRVRPHGAKAEPERVLRETFRREDNRRFLEKLFDGDDATGRYRETEDVFAVGDEVFIVGEAELDEATSTPALVQGRGTLLISVKSEESRTSKLGWAVVALVLVMIGAAVAAGGVGLGSTAEISGGGLVLGAAVSGLALLIASAIIERNRLLLVAEAAERALSLVGIQFQRRADLIPQMADVVQAATSHERDTQTLVAELRRSTKAPTSVDGAEKASAEQDAVAAQIVMLGESLPSLKAVDNWSRLMAAMTDCEDRIAASETFYNDAVTIMGNRRQAFPGRLFTPWLPTPGTDLFSLGDFERATPVRPRPFDD